MYALSNINHPIELLILLATPVPIIVVGSPGILVKEFGANSQTRSSAGICPVGPSGSIQYCPDLVTPAIPSSSQLFAAYF